MDPVDPPRDTSLCMNFQDATSLQMPLRANEPLDELDGLVKVDVTKVTNPDKYPIQIEILLSDGTGSTPTSVGKFSLFPVDNPGNYIFDLNQYISDRQQWTSNNIILRLTELPVNTDNSRVQICVEPVYID